MSTRAVRSYQRATLQLLSELDFQQEVEQIRLRGERDSLWEEMTEVERARLRPWIDWLEERHGAGVGTGSQEEPQEEGESP